MMDKQKKELTFVSYAHENLNRVRNAYHVLKKREVTVCFDKVDLGIGI